MIRGVNKTIIEISDTGNECFERAILFVRPASRSLDNDTLARSAREYMQGIRFRRSITGKKKMRHVLIGAAITIGAVAAALFVLLYF